MDDRLRSECSLVTPADRKRNTCPLPVWQWQGLVKAPDHAWTIATLFDAYYGFITFFVWVAYKEQRWLPRIGWLIAILLLGNMAMSAYVLLQLRKLPANEPLARLLTAQNP